jgi:hypothetical protein
MTGQRGARLQPGDTAGERDQNETDGGAHRFARALTLRAAMSLEVADERRDAPFG